MQKVFSRNVIIMKKIKGKHEVCVKCSFLWQYECGFVSKLCKLTTMYSIEEKENNFLVRMNKNYANFS